MNLNVTRRDLFDGPLFRNVLRNLHPNNGGVRLALGLALDHGQSHRSVAAAALKRLVLDRVQDQGGVHFEVKEQRNYGRLHFLRETGAQHQ